MILAKRNHTNLPSGLIDPAGLDLVPALEVIHETLLKRLEQVRKQEGPTSVADEGVMATLEQDLGEALQRVQQASGGILNASLRSRFLQFGHEHVQQRSASTASNARGTYSTKGLIISMFISFVDLLHVHPFTISFAEQLSMRLRFLAASNPDIKNRDEVMETKRGIL